MRYLKCWEIDFGEKILLRLLIEAFRSPLTRFHFIRGDLRHCKRYLMSAISLSSLSLGQLTGFLFQSSFDACTRLSFGPRAPDWGRSDIDGGVVGEDCRRRADIMPMSIDLETSCDET